MDINPEIVTLHRYFGYAAHMRSLFRREVDLEWLKIRHADMSGLLLFFYSE